MAMLIGSIAIVAIPILFAAIFFPDNPALEVSYPAPPPRRRLTDRPTEALLADALRSGPCLKPTRVVLTLSTSADRDARPTVQSLVDQSCPVDALYLFVMGDSSAEPSRSLREVKAMSDIIIVKKMARRSSNLLAALEEERDPSTWIITVEDDVVYQRDMVLALVVAAAALPSNVAPAFWCAQAFVRVGSLRYSGLPAGSSEGTVFGWCYSFAGVLYKRWFFDDQVFLLDNAGYLAPDACVKHGDVWAGGHMLSKGHGEFYLVNPGFMSFTGGMQTAFGRGLIRDSEAHCASWFAAYWGVFAEGRPANIYRHPHFQRREKDLKMLSMFGDLNRNGSFLESRALDGRNNSLSFFFEKELGWRGILIEPSEIQPPLLGDRNGSLVMQTAICGQAGAKRTWLEAFDGKSNLPGVAAFEDSLEKEFVRLMDFTREVRRTPLRCRQLKDILQQAEMPKLHFLALDCSWDAMDILSKFNFQDHDIDVIYLEVTRSKCRFLTRWTHPFRSWSWSCEKIFEKPLKDLLASNSYILVDTILVDIGGLPSLALKQFFFHYAMHVTVGLFFRRESPEPEPLQEMARDEVISSYKCAQDGQNFEI